MASEIIELLPVEMMRLSFSQSIVAGGDARTTHRILKSSLSTPFWERDASSHVIPTEIINMQHSIVSFLLENS